MKQNIIIFGATSSIAEHVARIYAQRNCSLVLVGRSETKLQTVAQDLKTRGAENVNIIVQDLAESSAHEKLVDQCFASLGKVDLTLIAYGTLEDQDNCAQDFKLALKEINSNFVSQVSLLISITANFLKQKSGQIAVITSVAGDRGRKKNYTYGSSKGGLALYLQGLRNRLADKGIGVCTIKPGFVDTPMTANMKKGLLFATPSSVAKSIVKALDKRKNILYVPWFWRWIMAIICSIPEGLFKKTSI